MDKVVELLLERGMIASRDGRPADAVRAYADVIARPDATPRQTGVAHFNRGVLRLRLEDIDGAAADFDALIDTTGTPKWLLCRARLLRGEIRWVFQRDPAGAIDDLSTVITDARELGTTQIAAAESRVLVTQDNSPLELSAQARVLRADLLLHLGHEEAAMEDIATVIGMEGISSEARSAAYANLSEFLLILGHYPQSIQAATRALSLSPRSQSVRFLQGLATLLLGDVATGASLCTEILSTLTHPRSVETLHGTLDRIETRKGKIATLAELRTRLENARRSLQEQDAKRLATKVRRLNLGG